MITEMTPEAFRQDIRKSKTILEGIIGYIGHRVPGADVFHHRKNILGVRNPPAGGILLQQQRVSRSGTIGTDGRNSAIAPKRMHAIDGKEIWEVPMSTWCFGSFNIPFGGGGYLRLYPWSLTKALFRKVTENGKPVVVYVHPWEFDHKHPVIDAPFLKRIRHHTGISGMKKKIRFLLQYFQFGTVEQHLEDMIGSKSTRP